MKSMIGKDDWSKLSYTTWVHKVYQYHGQPMGLPSRELQPTGRTIENRRVYPK
jgi:hypothetical protein